MFTPIMHSLEALIQTVQENERTLFRLQDAEFALIEANDLPDFLDRIFAHLPLALSLEQVFLTLLSDDPLLPNWIAERYPDRILPEGLRFAPANTATHLFLGQPTEEMFADPSPASSAILPLKCRGERQALGVLSLGSDDPQRFQSQMATDFLERFSSIVAVCLENVLNMERVRRIGLTDTLTGIGNRRFADQRLQEDLVISLHQQANFCCLLLDIDYFKKVNDQYGHPVGDRVLTAVAQRFQPQLSPRDSCARYGGEEFIILLAQSDITAARVIAENIRASVEDLVLYDDQQRRFSVTISIGVSIFEHQENDLPIIELRDILIQRADTALYRAKRRGRNRVEIWPVPVDEC